jgi:hypothetical protein
MSAGVIGVNNHSSKNNTCHRVAIVEVVLNSVPPQVAVKIAVELAILSVPLDVLTEVFVAQMVVYIVFY